MVRAASRWAAATACGAVLVTGVDAVLLERSKGFFRGGFLSVDYLEGPFETLGFLIVSLLVDAAFIGLGVAAVSWALRPTRLRYAARLTAGVLVAAGSLLAYDAAEYRILQFLGDKFDLRLMLDLVGGKLSEIFAVSSGQLLVPALVAVGGILSAAVLVALVQRYAVHAGAPGKEPMLLPVLLAVAGAASLATVAARSDVFENGLLRKPAGQAFATVVNAVSDVDRDGYGIVGRSSDPDPFDAAVYPYAVDRPGNAVDEDGVAGDLPSGSVPFADATATTAAWPRRPDVVMVVLESFRADLVGATFEGKPITPVLDALGHRGYSSPAAYSHNGYTVQSRFHLFTGTLAGAPGSPTLIDDFKARGYQVAYISGQDESFGGPLYDIGFSRADVSSDARSDPDRRYSTSTTAGSLAVPLTVVEEHVNEWLGRAASERPLFLCVNLHDTHFPYSYPAIETITSAARIDRGDITPGARDALWATYANTAANVDRAIGRVIDAVRSARGREPGIVVTSDHGESLFDEGFLGHGYGLNDAQTRVPFVVANLPIEIPEPFAQSELRPALLAAMSEPDGTRKPRARARSDAPILQYLGDLSRPRQLAFLGPDGRFIFDFRSRRAKAPTGDWLPPDQLPKREREEFLALVRLWERMQLTRYEAWERADGDG